MTFNEDGKCIFTEEEIIIIKNNKLPMTRVRQRIEVLEWNINRAITEPINKLGRHSKVFTKEEIRTAREKGISVQLLSTRLKRGWSKHKALITPPQKQGRLFLGKY